MEITDREAYDLICTALEGGIGYWSRVDLVERGTPEDELDYVRTRVLVPFEEVSADGPVRATEGARIEVAEQGFMGKLAGLPDFGVIEVGVITVDTIRAGLAKAEELGRFNLLAEVHDEQYDADTADQIVQLALFGEVVYG